MANVTVTTAANLIPEIWSSEVLYFRENKLVLANMVRRFDSDAKYGDVIHIPSLAEITARSKSASTDVTFDANTEGIVDITIDKHKYVAVLIEDIAQVQARPDLLKAYTKVAGYGVAKVIDQDIAAKFSGFSQIVGTYGGAITDAIIISAIVLLDKANAPRDDRHLVLHPKQMGEVMAIDKFILWTSVGPQGGSTIRSGDLGQIYGMDVTINNNLPYVDATVDQYSSAMFHRDALGLALQRSPKIHTDYMIEKLSTAVVVDAIYGVGELRDSYGVWIKG